MEHDFYIMSMVPNLAGVDDVKASLQRVTEHTWKFRLGGWRPSQSPLFGHWMADLPPGDRGGSPGRRLAGAGEALLSALAVAPGRFVGSECAPPI